MSGWTSYKDQMLEENRLLWNHVRTNAVNQKQRERAKRVLEEIEAEQKRRAELKATAQS